MWHWWQTAGDEDGTGGRAAIEKEIAAKVQVLAREEPKRSGRKDDTKRDEWKRDVDQARKWLRDRGVSTHEASRI